MRLPIKRPAEEPQRPAKKPKAAATFTITPHQRTVSLGDVHNLMLWVLTENQGKLPQWIFVPQKHSITKVVVLFIPGTDRATWLESSQEEGLLATLLKRGDLCTIVTPCEDDYLARFVLQEQRTKVNKRKWRPVCSGEDLSDYEAYLATEEQLRDNMFLLEGNALERTEGGAELVALDCEMVQTTGGRELARISVVGFNGDILYDTHVMTRSPVTDYLTQFSGVTAQDLEGAVTFAQVLVDLSKIISQSTIICGHSLENDLRALELVHKRVIDTSLLYPHPQPSYKYSLKRLAFNFLNQNIQNEGGHDSVEDSQAALALVRMKVKYGPDFGSMNKEYANLFDKLTLSGKKSIIAGLETAPKLVSGNVSVDLSGNFAKYLDSDYNLIISKLDSSDNLDEQLQKLALKLQEDTAVVLLSGSGNHQLVKE
mmetsp:Transcript_11415/g.22396  ORF Transcript_11415/g.22396 Transcript_11415/m.22396 type:complete len:427 (+) Transcript_11415:3-1283(+)